MKIRDNKVGSMLQQYREELGKLYEHREVEGIVALVFQHHLHFSRADLVLKRNDGLSESELLRLHFSLKELKKGRPVQYVLGQAAFYGMQLNVNEEVLIPRAETEELVQWIVEDNPGEIGRIVDIGTGSGCIALALKKMLPFASVMAIDVSTTALALAQQNAKKQGLEVQFERVDVLTEGIAHLEPFDVIVSNPPYVLESDSAAMETHVLAHEPHLALFVSDNDPLLFYHTIAEQALTQLKTGGRLYFEIHENYGEEIVKTLTFKGFKKVELRKDINGKHRMVRCVR